MDVAAGAGALFSVVYAAAGLLSGQFCKHRRGFYLLIFAAAYLLTLFCIPLPELRIGAGVELALAMGAYLVIPKKFVVAVGAFLQPLRGGSGESGLRRYVAGRVGGVAHAYQQLHDTACQAASTAENDADVAKVFDRAADRVCCRCKLQQECWTRRALDTLNIMNDVTRRIQARGRLLPEDFPPCFRDRCAYLHEYTEVVNGELRLRAYRQRMQETLQENRTVLWEQYADFAQVLTNVSRELDSSYGADPLAAAAPDPLASHHRRGSGRGCVPREHGPPARDDRQPLSAPAAGAAGLSGQALGNAGRAPVHAGKLRA